MAKIIQFNQKQEECECPYCNITKSYLDELSEYNEITFKDLEEIIDELVSDIRQIAHKEGFLTGSDLGFKEGYKSAIRDDIEVKSELLEDIEDECDCEECCDECEF